MRDHDDVTECGDEDAPEVAWPPLTPDDMRARGDRLDAASCHDKLREERVSHASLVALCADQWHMTAALSERLDEVIRLLKKTSGESIGGSIG